MSEILGQQIVVENRPGAGSSIAAEYVARAPKDGYTLLMATVANTINAAISTLPFDFGKDLAPIVLVANVPNVLVVHPSLGVSERAGADRARQGEARRTVLCLLRRRYARRISRASCSRSGPASSSCTCPIPAARKA